MANYPNHAQVTRRALAVQPAWIRTALAKQSKRLIEYYCLYGDLVVSGKPAERKIMERFMVMPDGKRAVMGPSSLDERENARVWYDAFQYWYAAAAHAVKHNRIADAAQFLGVISHALGDTTALAHPLSHSEGLRMELIKRLFPTKKKYRYMSLHNLLENLPTSFSITGHRPVLLGRTPDEAAFMTAQSMVQLATRTLAKLSSAIKALYADNISRVQRIAGDAYADSSRVYADIVFTAFSIGAGKYEPADVDGMKNEKLRLDTLVPYAMSGWSPHPYFFKQLYNAPCNFNRQMEPFPLMLRDGGGRRRQYVHGFGAGISSFIEYRLPKNTFRQFTCIIGLNDGLVQRTPALVEIKDGTRVLFSRKFKTKQEVAHVTIDLAGVNSLRFETAAVGKYEKFGTVDCHIVIADPVLERTAVT
ncbi:MAG: NPCBM/NEW2 domain-containing protein [Spirochaetes bacterium]|nr:NPCBM/NEW2 domain-containing protein [Spirochaetota bacterium]